MPLQSQDKIFCLLPLLYNPELLSLQWIKIGWQEKYSYTFSWLGRPIIQLPEDMIRIQEVIFEIKPDEHIKASKATPEDPARPYSREIYIVEVEEDS